MSPGITIPARDFVDPICKCAGVPIKWPEDYSDDPTVKNPLEESGLPNMMYATLEAFQAGINYLVDAIIALPIIPIPSPPPPALFIAAFMKAAKIPYFEFPSIPQTSLSITLTADAIIGALAITVSDVKLLTGFPLLASLDAEKIKILSSDPVALTLALSAPLTMLHLKGTPLTLAASISMPPIPTITIPVEPWKSVEDFIQYVTTLIEFVFALIMLPIKFIMGLLAQLPAMLLPTLDDIIAMVSKAFEDAGLSVPDPNAAIPEIPDPDDPRKKIPDPNFVPPLIPLPAIKQLSGCMGNAIKAVVLGVIPIP